MKKLTFLLLLSIISLSLLAQKKEKIKGDRHVVTASNNISKEFNTLEVADELKVTLIQGLQNSYTLTADKNLHDIIEFTVIEGTLNINTTSNITSSKKLEIMLTFVNLNQITLKNDAQIKVEGILKSNNLTIKADNSSEFELETDAKECSILLSGNVKGKLKHKGDDIKIVMSDKSDLNADISTDRMIVEISKSAKLELKGSSDAISLLGKDSSELDAKKMEVSSATLNTTNNAKAHVDVKKNLRINAKDKSSIYVYSEPKIDIEKLADKTEILKR